MSDIKLYAQFIAEQTKKNQLIESEVPGFKNETRVRHPAPKLEVVKENYDVASPVYHPDIRGHEIGNVTKKGGKFHAETYSNKGSSSSVHDSKREAEEAVIRNHLRNTQKTTNEAAYTPNTTRMIDPQPDKEKIAAQAAKTPEQRRKDATDRVRSDFRQRLSSIIKGRGNGKYKSDRMAGARKAAHDSMLVAKTVK